MYCYQCRHTSRGGEISSTYLQSSGKQYLHAIYGAMIHDSCMYGWVLNESMALGNGCILLDDDIEVVYCQDVSHPGVNMPATTIMFLIIGLIPLGFTTTTTSTTTN